MKKWINYLMTALIPLSAIYLCGCVNHIDDDEMNTLPEGPALTLRAYPRAANAAVSLSYPVRIYAFRSGDGSLAAAEILDTADDELHLSLPAGNYRLVALAGTENYTLPDNPTLDATIGFTKDGTSACALMMGSADVALTAANSAATLVLSYCVACLDIALNGVPDGATAVSVSLSPQYKAVSFRGDYSGVGEATHVACRLKNKIWTIPTCYLMPGSGQTTVLSIAATTTEGTQTYGYTYSHPLVAATPYVFAGNYQEGLSVNGSLVAEGWNPAVQIDFGFGTNAGGGTGEDSDGSTTVPQLPAAGTLWQEHLVVAVQNATSASADLLLLSLNEWQEISSAAASAGNPGEASATAAAYTENGLSGWRIPTLDEAKLLTKNYGTSTRLAALNALLATVPNAVSLKGKESDNKGKAVRYLCDGGNHSFSLASTTGGNTEAGGTRSYNLRLVNLQKVKVKN